MKAIGFKELPLSSPYNKYFQLVTDADLDNHFINILSKAIELIMAHSGFNKNLPILVVFISKSHTFRITYDDIPEQYGSQYNAVVLIYDRMKPLSELQKLICIVEEFVHYFWLTRNEIKTSKIVSSIIPGITCDTNGNYHLVD